MDLINRKRIWGIEYEDIVSGNYKFRRAIIKNPFMKKDNWYAGLNQKFLEDTLKTGIHKLILIIGQREIIITPPAKKEIKKMDFEDKESMFQGSPPMRIYHYKI